MNSSAAIFEKLAVEAGSRRARPTPSPSITSRLMSNGMISFGAASGWITCSGCGSKVSTVSASSITWRCPTCTPSKHADRHAARARLGVGEVGDLDAHRGP